MASTGFVTVGIRVLGMKIMPHTFFTLAKSVRRHLFSETILLATSVAIKDTAIGAGGLGFDSRVGHIGHSVANGSQQLDTVQQRLVTAETFFRRSVEGGRWTPLHASNSKLHASNAASIMKI